MTAFIIIINNNKADHLLFMFCGNAIIYRDARILYIFNDNFT